MSNQLKTVGAIVIVAVLVVGAYSLSKPGGSLGVHTANAQITAIYNSIPTDAGKANFMKQSHNLSTAVDPRLTDLDKQIITCSPNIDNLMGSSPNTGGSCNAGPTALSTTTGMYLGGQCCSTMTDLDDYDKELANLQQYKDIPDIILDPMHTPIPLAKKWIDYDNATTLNAQDQAVYDQAMAMSKEKPCCCKCWHYFVNEGIAKKMIHDYHYTAQQVANYWDNSDICGS